MLPSTRADPCLHKSYFQISFWGHLTVGQDHISNFRPSTINASLDFQLTIHYKTIEHIVLNTSTGIAYEAFLVTFYLVGD
jgi:hypothetical protein